MSSSSPSEVVVETDKTPASPPAGGLASADSINPDVVDMPETDALPEGSQLFANEITVLMVLLCASTVTMIAASRECDAPTYGAGYTPGAPKPECKNERAWAAACAVISMVLVLFHLVTHRFASSLHKQMAPGIGGFLVIWWICGVGAGTFKLPFKNFGNGWISEWTAFFASLYYCSMAIPKCGQLFAAAEERVSSRRETQYAGLLVLLSFVILLATLVECNELDKGCDSEYGYAIVASIISMVFAGAFIPFHTRCSETISKYFALFLFVWWAAAAGTFTFDKPFKMHVGNGWFASWGCFLLSLAFCLEAWGYGSEQTTAPSDADSAANLEAPPADPENPTLEQAEA